MLNSLASVAQTGVSKLGRLKTICVLPAAPISIVLKSLALSPTLGASAPTSTEFPLSFTGFPLKFTELILSSFIFIN